MKEIEIEEIDDFRKVISIINKELNSKRIYDMEYMLINNSVGSVMDVLIANSEYYNMIKDDRYSNGATFSELIEAYFQRVKEKYETIFISGKNIRTVSKYFDKLSEPSQRAGEYVHYPKSDTGMIKADVEKTLMLMREAILAYYKVYYDKKLVAELTTTGMENEYLEFSIKEGQLLHLLGVNANQLRENPDFIRLTGKKYMNTVDILEWIIKDLDGDNNLMQYSEDFIKRIKSNTFELSNNQFDRETQTRLLNYHKVRVKSQTFLKYGPFEKVSLVAKLQNGKRLTANSNSNIAIISRAECFEKYPWAYFGSVQTPGDRYIETLVIDSAEGKKELFKGSKPAIIKGEYRLGEEGGGTSKMGSHIFSEEEQFDLFCKAYESFQSIMDLEDLTEYFNGLLGLKKKF